MSHVAVAGGRTAWRARVGTEAVPAPDRPDASRALQLLLAALWLLDAVLLGLPQRTMAATAGRQQEV